MNSKDFEVTKNKNAGIYMLYNITEHKAYIGCTSNLSTRAMQHRCRLRAGKHGNKKLQEDYNKGCEFVFAVLEEIEKGNKDLLLERESLHILTFHARDVFLYNHSDIHDIIFNYIIRKFQFPIEREIAENFRNRYGSSIKALKTLVPSELKQALRERMARE